MPTKLRRVVTINDDKGLAIVSSDTIIESQPGRSGGSVHVCNIWMSDGAPPALNGPDALSAPIPMLPVPRGATFRMMEIGPGTAPHMHRTETLDYIIVYEGELEMFLDDGVKLHMKEGDIMIQRGTVHGWANSGDRPCRFATVIIDAGGGLFES
ncbi:MAG: cupin domain-containing protein [Betaproteobacteria bacterium]|nr:cupin domain-containing protein [Betaproteobacteria bacterium]